MQKDSVSCVIGETGGLFVRGTEARVPLTGVAIDVKGDGAAARVTVRQRYVNQEAKPVEAVYSFPLEEGSAVCELIVETGGRKLVGKIEEREKAFEQYDEAMAQGHGAVLADQDRPNIFTVSVGNLLPNQEATVQLTYATELVQTGDSVRLMLPTTISPRYVPASMVKTADPAELDRINPPTVLGAVPYGLSLKVEYTAQHGVKSVSCPSHPAEVAIEGNTARVELAGSNIQLDRDFVLNVTLAKPFEPGAVVTRDVGGNAGDRAVMINLFPDLKKYRRGPAEFVFIVDRSGSMQGDSITQALNALRLALRSMDEGDRFNIVGFGNSFESMFKESQVYNQKSLDDATQKLAGWSADLGGTELIAPLTAVLGAKAVAGLPRQVMLLTDGQVGNEAECIAQADKHAGKARVFTFGIGHGASEHLVKGLARAGGGQAEFIQPNERIEPKVLRQFARAASPFLKNVRLDWGGLKTDLVTPLQLPPLFDGDRLTVYARVIGASPSASGTAEVAVLADSPDGALRLPVTVELERPSDTAAVPVLMARTAIRELEEGRGAAELGSNQTKRKKKSVEEKVLELALRYQIMSSKTSFIAVEERAAGTQTERAELRRVPVALTHGWGGSDQMDDAIASSKMVAPAGGGMIMRQKMSTSRGRAGGAGAGAGAGMVPMPAPAKMRKKEAAPNLQSMSPTSECAPIVPASDGFFSKVKGALFGSSARPDSAAISGSIGYSPSPIVSHDHAKESPLPEPMQDTLMLVTSCQNADGSFALTGTALAALRLTQEKLDTLAKGLGGASLAVTAILHTALTLAVLEQRFADRQDEWRMIADKAERWLAKQTLKPAASHATWLAWARGEIATA